jgi:D-alanyl-D-alanine carboxypeptidase
MTVIDELNFDRVVEVPRDIRQIPRHRVGIRPGDMLTVKDLLHGMLIESGNDCAEVLARSYPKGGWDGFIRAMNRKAREIGAKQTKVYTPSGLDKKVELGRKDGKPLLSKKANMASAEDVAAIAQRAFKYPLIREISGMKTYTMVTRNSTPRKYVLRSNDRLLDRPLPVAGAKTGYTDLAGRCIVALFNDAKKAKNYLVVVLNSPQHFKTAEKVYNWVSKPVEAVGGKK